MRPPTYRALVALATRLAGEIQKELNAAGADEVAQHATLRGKQRVVDRARRRFAAAAAATAPVLTTAELAATLEAIECVTASELDGWTAGRLGALMRAERKITALLPPQEDR